MRTSRNTFTNYQPHFTTEDHWSVTVVYEDTGARDRAQSLCQHLVHGFKADIDFAFNWWRFRYLADPGIAHAAAQAAARADILLFSATNRDDLPDEVRRWTELWIPLRLSSEGVLLVLTEDSEDAELMASPLYVSLRNLARRASMDFLPRVSDEPWAPPPDDIRIIQNRATQGTRILDDILRYTPPAPAPPSHWGINE